MNGGGFFVYRHTPCQATFVPFRHNTRPMKNPSPLLLVALLFLACGGRNTYDAHEEAMLSKEMAAPAMARDATGGMPDVPAPPPVDRKVIRSGSLTFEVNDLDVARSTIMDRVQGAGGYVEGDDRNDRGSAQSLTVRVRVPAAGFDAFVEGIGSLGRLEYRSINAVDVTSEWVDVEARLATKRTLEKRYLELASQAKNVGEMLEVERGLGNVRAEIESMEARMKALRDQVTMSTLTITCTKQMPVVQRFTPRFGVAFKEGWNNLLRFSVWLTNLWPFVILIAVLVWWWRRRRRARKTS